MTLTLFLLRAEKNHENWAKIGNGIWHFLSSTSSPKEGKVIVSSYWTEEARGLRPNKWKIVNFLLKENRPSDKCRRSPLRRSVICKPLCVAHSLNTTHSQQRCVVWQLFWTNKRGQCYQVPVLLLVGSDVPPAPDWLINDHVPCSGPHSLWACVWKYGHAQESSIYFSGRQERKGSMQVVIAERLSSFVSFFCVSIVLG